MLKIGKITYLNVYPLYNSINSNLELIEGEPSLLNNLLRNGDIDISPSSSYEYLKYYESYLILKNFSISSKNKVLSVVLVLKKPIEKIEGNYIYLSPASATSNILLQVILKEFYKYKKVKFKYLDSNIYHENFNHLLIGDEALKVYFKKRADRFIYDLGEIWYNFTNLPFIFALWLINKKNIYSKQLELDNFIKQITKNKLNLKIPEKYNGFSKDEITNYFKSLDYNLTENHIKSLEFFAKLCKKYNFIKEIPDFNFY